MDDRRSRLGAAKFEQLQLMKFAWCDQITDLAAWNFRLAEEINLEEYTDFLSEEQYSHNMDQVADEYIIL